MPCKRTHSGVGLATGLAVGVLATQRVDQEYRPAEVVFAAIGGWIGGVTPDVLEPASDPNHRALFHSLTAGGGVCALAASDWVASVRAAADRCAIRAAAAPEGSELRQSEELKCVIWHCLAGLLLGFLAGYGSHLLLDAMTPRGLPVL